MQPRQNQTEKPAVETTLEGPDSESANLKKHHRKAVSEANEEERVIEVNVETEVPPKISNISLTTWSKDSIKGTYHPNHQNLVEVPTADRCYSRNANTHAQQSMTS